MELLKGLLAYILIFISKPLLAIVSFLFGIKIEDRLTQGFIGVIFLIFCSFFIIYIVNAKKSQRILENELKQINDIQTNDEILPKHLPAFIGLSKNCRLFARILMNYNDKLYATQDVESAVDELWSPEILQSRMFPTVSAILTGLGVLGTFVGLLIGLKGLDLSGNMEELQGQIQRVADGASVAFMTSVCGVFLSLVFTFAEKFYSGRIAGAFRKLQRQLALLFQPLPIMQVFADMNKATHDSKEIFGGLAEQIGDRMQKSLDSISENIIAKLAGSMAQATKLIAGAVVKSGADLRTTFDAQAGQLAEAIGQSGAATQKAIGENARLVSGAIAKSGAEMQAGIGESARQITGAVGQSGAATQKAIVENAQQVSGAVAKSGADTRASINANTQRLTVAVEETGRDAKDAISRTLEERISSIPEAISENLVPAIGKIAEASEGLAQQHASGAEGTLKNLVEKFTDSMGAEGAKQQEALAATTSQLKEAFSGFMGELKGFVEKFQNEQQVIIGDISQKITTVSAGLETFLIKLERYQNGVTEQQDKRTQDMEKSINQVFESQESYLMQWGTIISGNVTAAERLLLQGNELQKKIEDGKTLLDDLANAIQGASGSLERASGHLEGFGASISGSMDSGTKAVERAVGVVERIEGRQEEATEKLGVVAGELGEVRSGLEGVRNGFNEVSESLSGSADKAKEGFGLAKEGFDSLAGQYTQFQETLRLFVEEIQGQNEQQIRDLDEHMTNLLKEYSEIVNQQIEGRMTEWNNQTEQFCTNMANVVQVMQVLVSDIDLKRKN